MGLMDKVKAQAEVAMAKAKEGVAQGQAKLDQVQLKRQHDALLHDLGAACYAEQRKGGSSEAVASALSALDQFVATHGDIQNAPAPTTWTPPGSPGAQGGGMPSGGVQSGPAPVWTPTGSPAPAPAPAPGSQGGADLQGGPAPS